MGVLLLVRHGQASFGAADYDVLSELGVAQAHRAGEVLAAQGVRPSLVVHGAMRRQRDTAAAMARAATWQVQPEVDPRWDEFDHLDVVAAYDGKPRGVGARDLDRRAFQEVFEQATARWTAGASPGDDQRGYAESFAAFVDRSAAALRQATDSVGSGETAVVVTSGGVIAVVCATLTLGPTATPEDIATAWSRFNTVLVNVSVTRVLIGGSGVRLLSFNEHAFLDRSQVTYR